MDRFMKLTPVWRAGTIAIAVAVVALVVVVVASAGSSKPRRPQQAASVPTISTTTATQVTSAATPASGTRAKHVARKHAKKSGKAAATANGSSNSLGIGSSGTGGGKSSKTAGRSNCSSGASGGSGQLVMYGNAPEPQFKPVLSAFAKAHPTISINYQDIDDNVAFSKYRAEHAQGARTADILMASSPTQWDNNTDVALCWTPSDASSYPSYLQQFPGILIASPDPAISIYSKAKLPPNVIPNSFAQLVSDLRSHRDMFKGKIVTYSVDNQFGYSAFWGLVNQHGWSWLDALGRGSKPQADGTAMAEQLASGAANYGFFESGLIRGALTGTVAQLIGWTYMHDFTPLIPRGIAITKGASNPGAAKVFLNWMFSTAGQQAMCAAGFTAYKSGVSCPDSLASIQQAVGASNVFLVPFHSSIATDHAAFVQRWHGIFG
jgi:iron(III) transport system substrate-binding protein